MVAHLVTRSTYSLGGCHLVTSQCGQLLVTVLTGNCYRASRSDCGERSRKGRRVTRSAVGLLAAVGAAMSMLVSVSQGAEVWPLVVSGTIVTSLAAYLAQPSSGSGQLLVTVPYQQLRSSV
jgi:hypothetical protein